MGLLVHRYRGRFVSSASFVENAAHGQVVDPAVVPAGQLAVFSFFRDVLDTIAASLGRSWSAR